jgi:hypothetical protein
MTASCKPLQCDEYLVSISVTNRVRYPFVLFHGIFVVCVGNLKRNSYMKKMLYVHKNCFLNIFFAPNSIIISSTTTISRLNFNGHFASVNICTMTLINQRSSKLLKTAVLICDEPRRGVTL